MLEDLHLMPEAGCRLRSVTTTRATHGAGLPEVDPAHSRPVSAACSPARAPDSQVDRYLAREVSAAGAAGRGVGARPRSSGIGSGSAAGSASRDQGQAARGPALYLG